MDLYWWRGGKALKKGGGIEVLRFMYTLDEWACTLVAS